MKIRFISIAFILFSYTSVDGRGGEEVVELEQVGKSSKEEVIPLKEGNLKLSSSQLPGPLFGFGQNYLDKGDTLGFLYGDALRGQDKKFNDVLPFGVRMLTDKFSLLISVPVATHFEAAGVCSSGLEDMLVLGEYAFFSKDTLTAYNFATALGGVFFPTGSATKNPPTGNGSASYFAGMTAAHLATEWYIYGDLGVLFTTCNKGNKSGDQLLYQFGIGHNIKTNPNWICAWLVEFLGNYAGNDTVAGVVDCQSHSNSVSVAPSLWISTKRIIIQFGIAVPVMQHLPLLALKNRFILSGGVGWKFN